MAAQAVGLLVYFLAMVALSARYPKTSDQTAYFRAGIAVSHGHLRLGGWTLTAPDFCTSDIPLSALLAFIWRMAGRPEDSPLLLIVQPALLWTVLLASTLFLHARHGGTWPGRLTLFTLLGLPLLAMAPGYFVTLSAIHVGTVLYAVWALHFAATGRRAATSGMLILGTLGDPLMLVAAVLPIATFAAVGRDARTGALAIGAALLAECLLALNTATGGFSREILSPRFTTFDELPSNIAVTLHAMLVVFGADPSGLSPATALPELARLALIAGGILALRRAARRATLLPFPQLLALAAAFDVGALAFSNRIALEGQSIAVVRYLFPFWANGALLIALGMPRTRLALGGSILTLLLTLGSDSRTMPRHATGIASSEDNALIATLIAQAPHRGVGSWWEASHLTMASLDRLSIVPGITLGRGLEPFQHIAPHQTFPARPFFVLVAHPQETYSRADVVARFGAPDETRQSGSHDILIYR